MNQPDWTRLSLIFSRRLRDLPPGTKRGAELIPVFLGNLLPECCSWQVQSALWEAIKEAVGGMEP